MHHGAAFATHDGPLTRLRARLRGRGRGGARPDRRAFEQALDAELERARRVRGSAAVLLVELGEGTDTSELGRIRCYDVATRVGETRLAVLAPDCDEHGAYIVGERLRAAAAGPASVGVAAFPLHGGSPAALMTAAEHALDAATRLGGDRVVISSAEVEGHLAAASGEGRGARVELAMLMRLAEALDVKETGSASHSRRVGRLAELAARELGLAPERVERVRVAGVLHDVGRVGVPEELLRKPAPLSSEEWAHVRAHPEVGARMVETTELTDLPRWIRTHHERPDGAGYPAGLPGEEVPIEGRILAVADAWEAMTTERPYRPALAPDDAARELRRGAGTQFDEGAVEALLRAV